ncbi:MAG: hypothetical protein AAF411_09085, partial [Myxococcota bacterium]
MALTFGAGCAQGRPLSYTRAFGEGSPDEGRAILAAEGSRAERTSFGFAQPPLWIEARVNGPAVLEVPFVTLDELDVWVGD